jgi:hypothetical protein
MADTDHPVDGRPTPDPWYDPGDVVQLQLAALRTNDAPEPDAGIETCYNFASPANRRRTGPLSRFIRMVHTHQYRPLIDHREAVRGPVEREANTATQKVTVTGDEGRTLTYEFGVSLQSTDPFRDCWLTDRVVVV